MGQGISLYQLTNEHKCIYDLLEENGGEITPEIDAMLAINEANFLEKANGYCEIIAKYGGMAQLAAERIRQLQTYKKVAENAQKRLKERLQFAMAEYGLTKAELGLHKLSLRNSQAVEIIDETKIPNEFIKVKVEIDKAALREALLSGAAIEGAELKQNQSLIIK